MAFWKRQVSVPSHPAAPPEGVEAFKRFYDAGTLEEVGIHPVTLTESFPESELLARGLRCCQPSPGRQVQGVLPSSQISLQCKSRKYEHIEILLNPIIGRSPIQVQADFQNPGKESSGKAVRGKQCGGGQE